MRSRGSIVGALLLAVGFVAPVARAATIGYSLTISDTTVQVGDAMTLTPVVTGADPGETLRCEIWIEHYDGSDDWVRMHVASMGCEPWTFVVPPGPIGQYEVVGRLYIGLLNGAPTDFREVIQTVTLQAGGTPKPFTTNYPVQSWDLNDIVSTGTPKYGEPLTIYPPATGDDCDMRILGGLDYSHILQRGSCGAWTFSIPERNAQGPGTVLGQTSDVQVMAWTGDSPYAMEEPEAALVGERYGETYVVNLQDFTPGDTPATGYTSNLPAIFQGIDRGYTGQSGENTEIEIAPAVAGTTEGTCILPTGPSPVVPGGCEDGVTFQAWQGEGSAQAGHHLELRGTGGELLSYTDLVVAWVEDMSALQVDAPDTAQTGVETDIDAGTDTGAPSTYEIIAEPVTTGASLGTSLEPDLALAAAPIVIARGTLEPDLDTSGDSIAVSHAFASPGNYRVTATFTDVRGETTSGSTLITVTGADKVAPTTTAPKHAFATGSTASNGRAPVRFTWTGSDSGTGVGRYVVAISIDGGAWSTISTSLTAPVLTRWLAPGHTYRMRVRAVDRAGNYGAWTYGSTFRIRSFQETSSSVVRSGTWTLTSSSSYWGGGERYARTAGASARLTFTGRTFAWVGSMGPTRGSAKVYVNGVLVKTVSLYAGSTSYRRVLVSLSWSTSTSRTVKIVVVGTAGHPRVNVDAFVTGT